MDQRIADGLVYYVVFLFSTTLHEAAHAWVAMRGGDLTAYNGGQVSLNPLPHIQREPFGMVLLPLIGIALTGWPIGFASTPYNLLWARTYPKRAGIMALAGPAANLLLVIVTGVAFRVVLETSGRGAPGSTLATVTYLLSTFFLMNLLLCVFNLLPLPPLDGSGAVPLFLSRRATESYQNFLYGNPMFGMIGMFVAWQLVDIIFPPVRRIALEILFLGSSL